MNRCAETCNIYIHTDVWECLSEDGFIWCVKGTLCDIKYISKTWILTHAICAHIFTFSPLLIACVTITALCCVLRCFSADLCVHFTLAVFCVIWICVFMPMHRCNLDDKNARAVEYRGYEWIVWLLYELYIKRTKSEQSFKLYNVRHSQITQVGL